MWLCKFPRPFKPATHTVSCVRCQAQARQAALAEHMLAERANAIGGQTLAPSPDFMHKLAMRLRLELEREPSSATWELAVLSLRGWVLTFGATALLLIALAGSLALQPAAQEEEALTANVVETAAQNAFWMGE